MKRRSKRLINTLATTITGARANVAGINVSQLVDLAVSHGVHGLLNEASTQGRIDGLPQPECQRLHRLALADAAADLTQVAALRELLSSFETEGFRPLLLKGLPVAALHYPKRHLRHRTDVDLYLSPGHSTNAAQVLHSLGYRVYGVSRQNPTVHQFHASRGESSPIPIHFDLHWGISNRALFRSVLPFDAVAPNAQSISDLDPAALTLSNPHLLIHACVHRIAHGRNSQRDRLVWLNDIRLILASLDDQERGRFVDDALAWKVGAVCADGIASMSAAFQQVPDAGLCTALTARQALEPSAKLSRAGRWRWMLSDVAAEPGLPAQWRFVRQLIANRLPGD